MKNFYLNLVALLFVGFLGSAATAQRPAAPQLFPDKSIAYARVNDSRELKDLMAKTSGGKLMADKDMQPLFQSFYGSFTQLVSGMEDQVGLTLDELLSIPNGELAVALVPTKERLVFCVMLEAGSEMPAVEILLQRFEKRVLERANREKVVKKVGGIDVIQYKSPNAERNVGYFIDSGVFVGCASLDYSESLALIWQGSGLDHTPLSANRNFTDILSRCVGTDGERPQVSFYVDPIGIARETLKNSSSAFLGLAAIKTLGLDGIKAMGGSMILPKEEFDSIVHAHLLMENNRKGVLLALRPKSGSTEPEAWVNDSVVSYSTINWDFKRTISAVQNIADTFGGEDFFEENVIKNASKAMGIDFRKDFLDNLNDRFSMAQLILLPKRVNSQSNLLALQVKDPSKFESDVLPKLFDKAQSADSRWKSKSQGSGKVYYLDINTRNNSLRAPQPAFGMLGNSLMFSDSLESIVQAFEVYESGENLLSDAIEFKLIRDKIKAQVKGQEFSIMSYQRPDEQLRLFYDLASDTGNIDKLEQIATNNPFFGALVQALRTNKLPPFEQIAKYIVPTGAFVTEEDNGLHYTAFSLKRD